MSPTTRRLAHLRASQVASSITERSILLLPLGAVEQHGAHLPLETDVVIAEAAADGAVERFGDALDLWALPTVTCTKSDEHDWAPGTLSISGATLLAVLNDLGASVSQLAAHRLVIVNGHGGNSALLAVAARSLRLDHGLLTFVWQPPSLTTGGAGPEAGLGIHAGHVETSLMLHLRPDLVDMGVAVANVPAWLGDYDRIGFGKQVSFGWSSRDFGPSGVIGDPTGATAAAGAEVFETMIDDLGAALAEVARFDFPDRGGP